MKYNVFPGGVDRTLSKLLRQLSGVEWICAAVCRPPRASVGQDVWLPLLASQGHPREVHAGRSSVLRRPRQVGLPKTENIQNIDMCLKGIIIILALKYHHLERKSGYRTSHEIIDR